MFFDDIGFGWVVDKSIIKKIYANSESPELIVEETLGDLLKKD
ncbi:MAG: hypothetical protein PVJ67_07115 [Candidatus Pacearchaeota archaeon]|jgi:hypothetical protein